MKKRSRKPGAGGLRDQPLIRQLAEAALLAALFTVMAFQEIRFEGHETEKFSMLAILVAVIVGANLAGMTAGMTGRLRFQFKQVEWRKVAYNPLLLAVAALLLIACTSTLFSLSFTRSLWGSPSRAQGLLSLIFYLVLFWQASRMSEGAQTALTPILVLLTVPICLYAVIVHYGLDPLLDPQTHRPGSTTGNPNYLSSWLVMALLYCGAQLYWRMTQGKRPFTGGQIIQASLLGGTILLSLFTMTLTVSRGAVVGLGMAALLGIFMLAVLKRQRRLLLGLAVFLAVGGAGYMVVSRSITLPVGQSPSGLQRLLAPYDQVRIELWQGAVGLVTRQGEPLSAADDTLDRWVFLRPVLGYGPEMIEHTQSRLEDMVFISDLHFIDSFHNHLFDAVIMLGWLGLIAWLAIYEAAFFVGLRWLGLIRPGEWPRWLGMQFIGIPVGLLLIMVLLPEGEFSALVPLGVALGVSGGTLIWIGIQILRPLPDGGITLNQRSLAVIALLCIVSAQWIDNQFGFVQNATQPLWWILLGLLVKLTSQPAHEEQPQKGKTVSVSEVSFWYSGTLIAGVFLIHDFGVMIQSQYVNYHPASLALPLLLPIVWLVGMLGATFNQPQKYRRFDWGRALTIILVWLGFLSAKWVINGLASELLDNALLSSGPPSPASLQGPYHLLSLSGIGAAIIAIGAWVGITQWRQSTARQTLVIGAFMLVGCLGYSWNYTSATLHSMGVGFRITGQTDALVAADRAFEAATAYTPTNSRLRLHWMYALIARMNQAGDSQGQDEFRARIDEQITAILHWEPFFEHTREWEVFRGEYAAAFNTAVLDD